MTDLAKLGYPAVDQFQLVREALEVLKEFLERERTWARLRSNVRFPFTWDQGLMSIKPCVVHPSYFVREDLLEELKEYGSEACVSGTVDEGGIIRIETASRKSTPVAGATWGYDYKGRSDSFIVLSSLMDDSPGEPPQELADRVCASLRETYGDAAVTGQFHADGTIDVWEVAE